MKNLKDALWQNYKDAEEELKGLEIGTEEYKIVSENIDRIRNELIKVEQIEQEKNTKVSQIKSESKREFIRNLITIGTFGFTFIQSSYGLYKSFKFDEVSTSTSTLGKPIMNGVALKLFRR